MRVKIHDVRLWIFIHALLLFFIRPLTTIYSDGSFLIQNYSESLYIDVWIFTTLALSIFFVSFWLGWIKDVKLPINLPNYYNNTNIFLPLIIWFTVYIILLIFKFGSVSNFLGISNSPEEYLTGNSIIALNTWIASYSFHIVNLYKSRYFRFKNIALFLLIIFGFYLGLLMGSKSLAFLSLFVFLLLWSMDNNGVKFSYFFIIILIFISLLIVVTEYRHSGEFIFDSFHSIFSDPLLIFTGLTSRFYGVDIIYAIIYEHTYSALNFFYGNTYLTFFSAIIPRFMWDDKPIVSFGKIVSDLYLPPFFSSANIAASPTIIGESFSNFSYFGIVLVSLIGFIYGRLISSIYLNISKVTSNISNLSFYFLGFSTLAFILEVSLVGFIIQLLVLFISIKFLYFIAKIKV